MDRCQACRRALTNAISKRYGYGPDCLRRAVSEGNAPLEALKELTKELRQRPKHKPQKPHQDQTHERCPLTLDMFEAAKNESLQQLDRAVSECAKHGLQVTYQIHQINEVKNDAPH